MRRRHGDLEYFLVRDRVLLISSSRRPALRLPVDTSLAGTLSDLGIPPEDVGVNAEKLFRFDHMFREANLPGL